jgi:hypothetical protein
MMKTTIAAVLFLIGTNVGGTADPKTSPSEKKEAVTAQAAFEALKALTGSWEVPDSKEPMAVTYRVISGSTTVMETTFPGTPHEMITMYHLDGADLVLTH